MVKESNTTSRREFIKGSAILTAGLATTPLISYANETPPIESSDNLYLIGPQKGYTPQIGTLLSTMTMMRTWVIGTVKDLTVEQLDFQIDEQSNSIGAMLFHLAATERYYQLNTFDEISWGQWSDDIKKEWDVPMGLGEKGREVIKGNPIGFYLDKLKEVREITKKEFAKRDDEWIMKSEPFFSNQPTNNYAKWFHVCEHESNHRGQIKFIIKRLPA
ncbi:DinB family protein [Aquimarina sp. 2201CG14-23]|uniref:DinB family protein n=1 Tax=Aquimarina mycalae TaxID=3040073 RepID=UPI0024780D34|nr:DinB family protein [Aquimarina sp. 2201CG14-23]MDH7444386.1 DinB family protein [Aquimarina sp. 2201CG14-23]